jgi:2-polyprenyl-6-methoxyphenol hydroxylase-like FAD-dependent oxidoreductase
VTLVGDAGYCPGPAVGGGSTVAVVGAYVLAGELAAARGDHVTAFAGYEAELREFVRGCRTIAPTVMKMIPRTARQVWLTTQALRILPRLPYAVQRMVSGWQRGPAKALESITLKQYE